MRKFYIFDAILICGIAALCVVLFISTQQKNTLQQQKEQLIIQNVQQTKQDRAAISDAYKAGLIACGNEDVQFLNDTAYEYSGTLFAKILRNWAKTWAYDEETLREMVEDYMSEEVH